MTDKPVLPLFDVPAVALFDGATYEPEHDEVRLTGQMGRVHAVMMDGEWRTLAEIAQATCRRFRTHDPEASISARLRDLRKERFGGVQVERRRRAKEEYGLFEYRIAPVSKEGCRSYADSVD